ncbi:spore germination protein GerPE [Peribacillus kribbensis]|uniref:spore germination protein GerPE n=1 Tax=Peribacillus kribbensis TaxID=356658 RepID=UPI00041E774D|nr:spore germination protein GerPE [Peribacillus kribbensis]
MLTKRVSKVKNIHVHTLLFSSVLEIGDSAYVDGTQYTLAIQREEELFFSREGSFNYPIFINDPRYVPITEPVQMNVINENPFIQAGTIDIGGVSASSVIHIGSTRSIRMLSRVKNIRELLGERHPELTPPGSVQSTLS